ncbi:MAG: response regulator transcription factor [Candidatus Devosia phytovorans]|uniref:Regulatory protein VirG n=1 Tax=Candidatus Devosia phytovorans TaxID=3121372 RepID=A0AAJ5VXB6_9HYPH|nr:response regulator transcription factor [Devosia sp.]WEK06658.1 MAG: response regulator transcription factor [Devosia sp.]
MVANILVVDDDPEIRRLLSRFLTEQGFRTAAAGSRAEFDERMAAGQFDLVILDVMLPDGSGLDICRSLRNRDARISIILVTALKEEVDRIVGLELGADDYLGKPFSPRELVARIRAVLRRAGDIAPAVGPRECYSFAGYVADPTSRTVTGLTGDAIDLTGAEFQLLQVLLDRPGRILSREQLLDLTQGREAAVVDRSIDVLISRIRRKFREAGHDDIVKTVRNGGYQLSMRVERVEASR